MEGSQDRVHEWTFALLGLMYVSWGSRLGGSSTLPAVVLVDDLQGEAVEFGEQGPEFAGVVEPRLVVGELFGAEDFGDGLAVDFAGPDVVGPVQLWRVGVAAAIALSAGGPADLDGAG